MSRKLRRLADRGIRGAGCLGIHRCIDIWTERERYSPGTHGTRRIEPCSFFKGTDGFLVIERVVESETLVEVALCLWRACGDGVLVIAQVLVERDAGLGRRCAVRRRVRMRVRMRQAANRPGKSERGAQCDDVGFS